MTTATTPSASEEYLLDSSIWLEYFTNDTKADAAASYLEGDSVILVPTIVLYEVRKILLLRKSNTLADEFLSEISRRQLVTLDGQIALAAIEISIDYQLPMADAIIYATAQTHRAQLITSDTHFANLPGVTVL